MNEHPLHELGAAPSPRQKNWFRKFLCTIFLWIPLTLAGGNIVLGVAGVCVSQMRKWTDDELIEAAVRQLAGSKYEYTGDDGVRHVKRDMAIENTESAIQKFLKDNPRCCEVTRVGYLLRMLAGLGTVEVEVNYEQFEDPLRSTGRYNQQFMELGTCGEGLRYTKSFGSSSLSTTNYVRK